MNNLLEIETIEGYCRHLGAIAQHPLITITYLSELHSIPLGRKQFGFYCIFFNEKVCGPVSYGRGSYNYKEDTMLFSAPGQTIGVDRNSFWESPKGVILMIHPDYMLGTSLGKKMKDFSFFNYDSNEALHVSKEEKSTVMTLFHIIKSELTSTHDSHTKEIVCAQIGTLFNYCSRFYDRQFLEQNPVNNSIANKLDFLLDNYFESDEPHNLGIPTVQYCARKMRLSPNYFGDLIKKITGRTAQERIHSFIINKAKFHLLETNMTVSEIAYHLGFRYPHHLTRLFKKITGLTPNEFKNQYKRK